VRRIEIISASAGSGKTTRLSRLLQEAVTDGSARPEAVLATTFTNKAAAELQQRVRTTLLAAGRTAEAQQLSGARIGTVNAVCGQLVGEYAFELGLSPELKVLDETASRIELKRALTAAVSEAEADELAELKERLVELDWQEAVRRIVDVARANRIGAEGLKVSAEKSVEGLLKLFGAEGPDGQALDESLRDALETFIAEVKAGPDATKGTQEAVRRAEDALRTWSAKGALPWGEWLGLAGLKVGAKSREAAGPVWEAAGAHHWHPGLRADLSRAIRLCFEIAGRALTAYEAHKAEWGAIDFVDQEVLALKLLEREDLRDRLGAELDLVLVDEFQDTSPIQLAIFLALSKVAKRSVWVGDQKQSIFAFRGTDPALMDAALEQVLGTDEPETLGESHRSRPELVEVASEAFARVFATHGMPESRVRLKHPSGEEPAGLGSAIEYHRLVSKNAGQDLAAIADGVVQLLGDPSVKVRDRASGEARTVRPGDVAVLCKTNDACEGLAGALGARGVAAVVPRAGLLTTLEGQLVVAGLQLLTDERDSLAAAVLARMLEFPLDGDGLLKALLTSPGKALEGHGFVQRLSAAREAQSGAGPLAAFDAVVSALEVPARCAAWGNTAQRLANVDALRAHAVAYVGTALEEGAGCTAAGLVAYLRELAQEGLDDQATVGGEGAVVITTWHKAKGLEWPVVVLHGNARDGSCLGVNVESEGERIDIDAPLAGRWIRFWLTPYKSSQTKAPFHDLLGDSAEEKAARERGQRQEVRLLYVGWTRARDRLVLTGRGEALGSGMNALLSEGESPLLGELGEVDADGMAEVTMAGRKVRIRVREAEPREGEAHEPVPGAFYPEKPAREWPPAFTRPSDVGAGFRPRPNPSDVASPPEPLHATILEDRLPLSGVPDMNRLGEAVHTYLAAALGPAGGDEQLAEEVLSRWGVTGCLRAKDLAAAAERLRTWADDQFPGAKWHRELPLFLRQPEGSVLRGAADLVLETESEWILVDHKSFPGTREQAEARALGHAGQLRAYAEALRADADKRVRGFIHLPVTGQMVEVGLELAGGAVPMGGHA
jgi:ATP-dependent exoDNAse (exonuclease V) beta subunit